MSNFNNNIDKLVSKILNEEIENKVKQLSENIDEGEWTEIEVDEQLKGNQKKIDVAEPKGKITAADFKKLRDAKSHKEEVEEFLYEFEDEESDDDKDDISYSKEKLDKELKKLGITPGSNNNLEASGLFKDRSNFTKMMGSFDDEHGFYDQDDRQYTGDFDFDYDEEEFDDFDSFDSKYGGKQGMFDKGEKGKVFFNKYKDKFGKPFRVRTPRNMDESYNHKRAVREAKSTIKPKGVGIGSGPKFTYKDKIDGGFKEDKKQGPKSVGTGKAKFEYKKGENMEQKSKVVKAETKEGQGYKDKEDERLAMKHGKIASKDLKTTKARRDDAGFEKRETKEAARTYGMGSKEGRGLRKGITNNRNFVYGKNGVKVESTREEVNMLREKNEEYRKALNVFREKLNEVAIFNSNLAYATRLFTEHSTTKKEKINILRRFDNVETLKESKNLYQSIKGELSTTDTKSINESVEVKLNKNVSTGSSTNLIESKTYENPQFLRMKDLMSKIG